MPPVLSKPRRDRFESVVVVVAREGPFVPTSREAFLDSLFFCCLRWGAWKGKGGGGGGFLVLTFQEVRGENDGLFLRKFKGGEKLPPSPRSPPSRQGPTLLLEDWAHFFSRRVPLLWLRSGGLLVECGG